ncbi:MAG: hypothetical protein R2838_10505 [Caldilineaceae bacterium]
MQTAYVLGSSIDEETPFSQWLLRELHQTLMDGVRGSTPIRAPFASVKFRLAGRLALFLRHRFSYRTAGQLNKSPSSGHVFTICWWHLSCTHQFEAIHPFEDGNELKWGRTTVVGSDDHQMVPTEQSMALHECLFRCQQR